MARETLEETAHSFTPTALLGVYQYHHAAEDVTYLRFAFTGDLTGHDPGRALDTGIVRAVWLSPEEIRRESARHRSPLVMRCVDDYLAGRRYPLAVLYHHATRAYSPQRRGDGEACLGCLNRSHASRRLIEIQS